MAVLAWLILVLWHFIGMDKSLVMNTKQLFFFILFGIVGFPTLYVYGATVSIDLEPRVHVGTQTTVAIWADLEGESMNSADISLAFPSDIVAFRGHVPDSGVLSLWVITPQEEGRGVIRFSGVIPGGVERRYDPEHPTDRRVLLGQLLFEVRRAGTGNYTVSNAQLLRNDGLGTPIISETQEASIVAIDNKGVSRVPDGTSPRPFTITILPASSATKTPQLVLFSAQDEDSGIERYEIRIGRKAWERATSPYPLPHRLFGYTLSIRAFDFSGNYQEQSVTISGKDPWRIALSGILLLLVIVFCAYHCKRKNHFHE